MFTTPKASRWGGLHLSASALAFLIVLGGAGITYAQDAKPGVADTLSQAADSLTDTPSSVPLLVYTSRLCAAGAAPPMSPENASPD